MPSPPGGIRAAFAGVEQEFETKLRRKPLTFQGCPELRRSALNAMRELQAFQPRLTGGVLRGVVDPGSVVQLHLFTDCIEEVGYFLQDQGIPFRQIEQGFNFGDGKKHRIPGYGLVADGVPFELLVFSGSYRHRRPQCPIEGRAMRGATANEVQSFLSASIENG